MKNALALLCALALPLSAQTAVQGWEAAGQIWITWDETPPEPDTYEVWAADYDLLAAGTVVGAERVGRLLPADWRGARLQVLAPGTGYSLPTPGGGTTTMLPFQGVYAHTAHDLTPLWFAVVKQGDTAVGASNSVGPISPTLTTPTAHLQAVLAHPSGQGYRVYAHWIDGNDTHTSGRPGYPVMGNQSMNGVGTVVMLTEPLGGVPPGPAPALMALHGGGGNLWNFGPNSELGLALPNAWLITPDGTINSPDGTIGSSWLGYWEGFDRFTLPFAYPVPDDTVVVDYLARRAMWQLDWLLAQHPIDPQRVSVVGHSSGARGAGMLSRAYPERFAAAQQYCSHLESAPINAAQGDVAQDLPTTLPGSPGVASIYDESVVLSPTARDLPFGRFVIGTNDTAGTASWNEQQVIAYGEIDQSRHGRHLYWDERAHGTAEWGQGTFHNSAALNAANLVEHAVDRSYPAVHDYDEDPLVPGQQPFMGSGDPPLGGDPFGTFGGYVDWETASLVDTSTEWACTLFLTALASTPNDNFPGSSARVGVAIRRPQSFAPPAGSGFHWRLTRVSDGAYLQGGIGTVEPDGLVDVPGIELFPDPERVRLRVWANAQAQPYGSSCAGTGGFEPQLSLLGAPAPGSSFTVQVAGMPGGAPVFLLLGLSPGALPWARAAACRSRRSSPCSGPSPARASVRGRVSSARASPLPRPRRRRL